MTSLEFVSSLLFFTQFINTALSLQDSTAHVLNIQNEKSCPHEIVLHKELTSPCICLPPGVWSVYNDGCPSAHILTTAVQSCVQVPMKVLRIKRLGPGNNQKLNLKFNDKSKLSIANELEVEACSLEVVEEGNLCKLQKSVLDNKCRLSLVDCVEVESCSEDGPSNKNLIKRQTAPGSAPAPPSGGGDEIKLDEDDVGALAEVGDPLMQTQMNMYMDSVIGSLTGNAQAQTKKSMKPYPVLTLLQLSKQIMQKTCSVMNSDYFNLATNSFINLQTENFHIREPYISYAAFFRISKALTKCLEKATPHQFILPSAGDAPLCDNQNGIKSTNMTQVNGKEYNLTVPEFALGFGATLKNLQGEEKDGLHEPLIETVWKIVVNAHSYCYQEFSEYYNDHHTYTVSLMPLFTNDIQDIWLKVYQVGEGKGQLYGGLLGDAKDLIQQINNCVAASRVNSAYPWFMNRPHKDTSNKWRRKRSLVETGSGKSEGRCSDEMCKSQKFWF